MGNCKLQYSRQTATIIAMPKVEETDRFVFFWQGYLSQWYPSKFTIDGVEYNTAEQYMMAEKARFFLGSHPENADILKAIMTSNSPREQKALGGKVRGFVDSEWVKVARDVVYRGNLAKFQQNPDLKEKLLATGSKTIVEASPIDQRWGIGLSADDPRAREPSQWRGHNWLGEAIMQVRQTLNKGK
jgi:ribA/ribD-fused uncharacterized protein